MNNYNEGGTVDYSGLVFRGLKDEGDFARMLAIISSSLKADGDTQAVRLEDIARKYTPSAEMDPTRQLLIAALAEDPEDLVAYSRLDWYSSQADNRLYCQVSHLRAEFRGRGLWRAIIRKNEERLRELALEHPRVDKRYFQAWAGNNQPEWTSALEGAGYRVVRQFNNMLYTLGDVPQVPLPPGFEVRTVQPQDMRSVWEAQKEMNDGLFENVVEEWVEEKFPAWAADSGHTPHLWQVAWDGERLAGMVLCRIDEEENRERGRKRGYTEHVYVRPGYRGRGLASALVSRGLQALKAHGMEEAELGVDSQNESAAFRLYENMGYKTFSIDTWFRKSMDL